MMTTYSRFRQIASAPLKGFAIARNEGGFIRLAPMLGLFIVLPAAYLASVTNNRILEAASAVIGAVSLGSLVVGEIASRRTKKEIAGLKTDVHDRDEHIADLDEAGRQRERILDMVEGQNSTLRSDLLSLSVHERLSDNHPTTVHRENIS